MKHLKKFNEHNHAEIGITGLKCDNPDCDYVDDDIPFSDYESSINKPCPKCGENLLTQDNYDQVMQMVQAVEILNGYSEEDLKTIAGNLSPEEIDGALDMINQLKLKKSGEEGGKEIWSSNQSI